MMSDDGGKSHESYKTNKKIWLCIVRVVKKMTNPNMHTVFSHYKIRYQKNSFSGIDFLLPLAPFKLVNPLCKTRNKISSKCALLVL